MAGKKVLIVYAHQEPKSFNGSLKKVAVEELSKQGCTVTVSISNKQYDKALEVITDFSGIILEKETLEEGTSEENKAAETVTCSISTEEETQAVMKVYSKEDYSVVNRFESHGGGWGYSAHSVEAIRFSADTDILLGGLGLFGGRGEYVTPVNRNV